MREIWRNTLRLTGGRVRLRQHRIAEIDSRSQFSRRREIFQDVGRHGAARALGKRGNRRGEKYGSGRAEKRTVFMAFLRWRGGKA